MKNVKLNVTKQYDITTVDVTQLIEAVSITTEHSIEDVTGMMEQDGLLPRSGLIVGPTLALQRSYWRKGDWFDDALKNLMLYNRVSKLTIIETGD